MYLAVTAKLEISIVPELLSKNYNGQLLYSVIICY